MRGYKYSKGAQELSKTLNLRDCDWVIGYVEAIGWCVIFSAYGNFKNDVAYGRYRNFAPVTKCNDGTYSEVIENE